MVSNAFCVSRDIMYVGSPWSLCSAVTLVTIRATKVGDKPTVSPNGRRVCSCDVVGFSLSATTCSRNLLSNGVTTMPLWLSMSRASLSFVMHGEGYQSYRALGSIFVGALQCWLGSWKCKWDVLGTNPWGVWGFVVIILSLHVALSISSWATVWGSLVEHLTMLLMTCIIFLRGPHCSISVSRTSTTFRVWLFLHLCFATSLKNKSSLLVCLLVRFLNSLALLIATWVLMSLHSLFLATFMSVSATPSSAGVIACFHL